MEDVVRIGLPLGECVGLQHRQSWLRFPPNTDEEVHSCWAYRNSPLDKANLFNSYFFDQFSEASNYDVSIDWTNDSLFDIDFNPLEIKGLLSNLNSNKACGPDGIHGKILKHCAVGLADPLSMLFKLSYNSGSLPKDWRVANVVPVHKKGNKDNIENYRPISLTSLVMKTFERILKKELLLRTAHLGPSIKDVRKNLPFFDPPSPLVRGCPKSLKTPPSPRTSAFQNFLQFRPKFCPYEQWT